MVRSILHHEVWPLVSKYLRVDESPRDPAGHSSRVRIELGAMPHDIRRKALAATMLCVSCGYSIQPFRTRKNAPDSIYYACTCPTEINLSCQRSRKAHEEYDRVRAWHELHGSRGPQQLGMF